MKTARRSKSSRRKPAAPTPESGVATMAPDLSALVLMGQA